MGHSKFINERQSNGQPLYWSRAAVDGFPFRGENPPLYTEQEALRNLEIERDTHVRLFDLQDSADVREMEMVLDRINNGLGRSLSYETVADTKRLLIWCEFFVVDKKRRAKDDQEGR